jgi:exopolysaccharide production protein ExoZ
MRPAASAPDAPRNYLQSLQAFRGLAALAVLLSHLTALFHSKLGIDLDCQRWLRPGSLGADFFFVLSGFIIFYTHRSDIGLPTSARKFITRRLTRLYPVFLSVCAIRLMYVWMAGAPDDCFSPGRIAASLLMLPQSGPPLLDVAWTLSYELLFYMMFLFLILCGARMWLLFYGHAAFVLAANAPGMPHWEFPASFAFSPYFLEFYAGCLACHLMARRTWSNRAALLLAGLALILFGWLWLTDVISGLPRMTSFRSALFWGTAFSLVTLGAAGLGSTLNDWVPRAFRFLGDASYSVYLVHGAALNLAMAALKHPLAGREHLAGFAAVVAGAGALAAGCGYYIVVEKPLLRLCRRWFPEKK